jgi:mannose-6-phosphate isomerase
MKTGDRIDKPWGWEEILELNDHYCIKHMFINSGHRLSKQYHERKTESLMLVHGEAELSCTIDGHDQVATMELSHLFPIPPGMIHRLKATGAQGALILEVSTLEVDDIVRLEDDYGRADA